MATHTGGCHCGRVRFEVIAPAKLEVADCNCSMCSKSGYLHLIVPADRFKLISGRDVLTTYSFNTHIAKHFFCSVCGVMSVQPFDGREWEKGRAAYRDASDS